MRLRPSSARSRLVLMDVVASSKFVPFTEVLQRTSNATIGVGQSFISLSLPSYLSMYR